MSVQKLRELKLYRKLQRDLTYREKLQQKIKQISHGSSVKESVQFTRKLNNNKKYLMEEQKNAQIERQNRILFQKIQSKGSKLNINKFRQRNRSSKTFNSIESSQDRRFDRKYYNLSQNKIDDHLQSRISFEENEEIMRPKIFAKKKKMITELTQEVVDLLKSRLIETRTQNQETILFQGIADIDSVRFKVKISIKNKIYLLSGRNKHTQIMLKMNLSEYKKFHKQILKGNPSKIFDYLMIDKGKIRFRRLQEQKMSEQEYLKRQRIYLIEQEQDEENQQLYKKHLESKKTSGKVNRKLKDHNRFLLQKYRRILEHEDEKQLHNPIEHEAVLMKKQQKSNSIQKITKRDDILPNTVDRNKPQKIQKFRTLQDYVNSRDMYQIGRKEIYSGESTEVETKNFKDRYRLPCI